jgi:hypothetical protein
VPTARLKKTHIKQGLVFCTKKTVKTLNGRLFRVGKFFSVGAKTDCGEAILNKKRHKAVSFADDSIPL